MRTATALALVAALAAGCAHGPTARERQAAEVHHDLGLEALRAGRAPEALSEFDQALALDPAFSGAWLGKGLVLEYGFGKLPEAEQAYRKALQLRPGYSEASNNLGQLLARTGRTDEAVKAFDEALANMLYKEPWVARCNRGQVLWRAGRKEEGQADLKACLAQAPAYCAGRREFGRLLLAEGRTAEALEQLSAYARSCEKVADAHLQLGTALMRQQDVAGARERFERCEALDPNGAVGAECRRSRELLQ